jgi:serine protease
MSRHTARLVVAVTVLVLTACQDTTAPESGEAPVTPSLSVQPQADRIVPGRVLVRLADGTDADAFAQANGITFERPARSGGFGVFRGPVGNERALAARLRGDVRVEFAEADHLRQTTEIDPRLWAFRNPGGLSVAYTRGRPRVVDSYLSTEDADEDNVEGYGAGGSGVSIASIDTGVELSHAEFGSANLVPGWDFYSNDADPSDTNDHGTHTTGTMAGDNVGVAGVAGAAPNVTVYVYRVCGPLGCPSSAIADAIVAATDAGVVAMNLSLGGGPLSSAEAAAIQYATNNDALVIAAAGNSNIGTVSCPACDPNAISVAASNWQDGRSYYSSWGPGLDLIAPGGELYSNTTDEAGIYSSVRNGYAYFQGTSMAAPQVTGTAAIVASVTGDTGAALRARLEGSADDLGPVGYDTEFGHGRLNSYRAVTGSTLNEGAPPLPPPPPPGDLAAAFSFSCSGLSCDFDASSSTGAADYAWIFGDGGVGNGVTASHTYGDVGEYTVRLTVSDGSGGSDFAEESVVCSVRGKRVRCR